MVESLDLNSIQAKREQVLSDIANAEAKISYLKTVLADLEASERVLTLFSGGSPPPVNPFPFLNVAATQVAIGYANSSPKGHCDGNPFRKGTNKAFMWDALALAETLWLDANEIQERSSALKGEEIPMATISPTLSNMKGEYIERKGLKVALKSRLNENEGAEAPSDADEGATSSDH